MRKVWGRLVNMLLIEGAYIKMLSMFYRVLVHVVLLFGSDSWVLPEVMEKTVEGAHTVFMCQIMGKRALQNPDRTWVKLDAGELRVSLWMHSLAMYLVHRQEKVSQWVYMLYILIVCTR